VRRAASLPLVAALAVAAAAEPAPPLAPKHRVVLGNLFAVRLNPLGLEDQIRLGYQLRLLDRNTPLFRDTFFFAGVAPRLNPAFIKIGPSLEIQPLSIFNLHFGLEYVGYFSSFKQLQSFGSPLDDYSDPTLDRGKDAGRNYATGGLHVVLEPLVQVKLGPIAVRNKLAFEYWLMDVRAGDRVFYDITLDTLVPKSGWVLANDLDVVYVSKVGVTVGARYSVVQPLYAASDFRPGEDRTRENNGHQRLGPLFAYTFFDRGYTRFNKPTLVVITAWYLDHRYRTGAAASEVVPSVFARSGGIPYVVLGFAFQSDLLAAR
jgi:hypothetical protein